MRDDQRFCFSRASFFRSCQVVAIVALATVSVRVHSSNFRSYAPESATPIPSERDLVWCGVRAVWLLCIVDELDIKFNSLLMRAKKSEKNPGYISAQAVAELFKSVGTDAVVVRSDANWLADAPPLCVTHHVFRDSSGEAHQHYVILVSVNESASSEKSVSYLDPGYHTRIRTMPFNDFCETWSGVAIVNGSAVQSIVRSDWLNRALIIVAIGMSVLIGVLAFPILRHLRRGPAVVSASVVLACYVTLGSSGCEHTDKGIGFPQSAGTQDRLNHNNFIREKWLSLPPVFEGVKIPTARHAFRVRNSRSDSFEVAEVKTSCGCTQSEVSMPLLGPGAATDLEIVANLSGRSGRFDAQAVVFFRNVRTGEVVVEEIGFEVGIIRRGSFWPQRIVVDTDLAVLGEVVRVVHFSVPMLQEESFNLASEVSVQLRSSNSAADETTMPVTLNICSIETTPFKPTELSMLGNSENDLGSKKIRLVNVSGQVDIRLEQHPNIERPELLFFDIQVASREPMTGVIELRP